MPFSNEARVRMRAGVCSLHTMSTMRRPDSAAMRAWPASTAGIEAAPGSVMPIASAMPIMVAAVPMVMHVPWLRAMPPSTPSHSVLPMRPARRSSQNFQPSEPEPSTWPL